MCLVAIATLTAAAAAEVTATLTTASAAPALFARARFVDVESSPIDFAAVQGRNGLVRFRIRGHFDKSKATGLTCVHDQ